MFIWLKKFGVRLFYLLKCLIYFIKSSHFRLKYCYKKQRVPLCKLPETDQHMLFTCIQKQDLWKAAFKKYLSNPKDPNCSTIFQNLSTLRLSNYYILHYHDKFTIYVSFLLQSSDLNGKLTDNNFLNRFLSWMRLSLIKFIKNYWNYLLTIIYANIFYKSLFHTLASLLILILFNEF